MRGALMCKILAAVMLVLAPLLLVSCRSLFGGTPPGTAAPPRVTFVLFDISGSTEDAALRRIYLDDFGVILEHALDGETVVGDRITENTLATASYPIRGILPHYDPFINNRQTYTHARALQQAALQRQAKALVVESSPAPHTDLMNAFQLAAVMFDGEEYRGAREKRLVIFSDMIEQTAEYDFVSDAPTPARTAAIIEQLQQNHRLPDLTGVTVWIAGAGVSSRHRLPARSLLQIRDFWLAYFTACGAEIDITRYAPRLVNYP